MEWRKNIAVENYRPETINRIIILKTFKRIFRYLLSVFTALFVFVKFLISF